MLFKKAPIVTSTIIVKKDNLTFVKTITEDDIREEAYRIWEKSGKQGDSLEHWFMAKDTIEQKILKEVS